MPCAQVVPICPFNPFTSGLFRFGILRPYWARPALPSVSRHGKRASSFAVAAEVYHGTFAGCPFSILFGSPLSKIWIYAISAGNARSRRLSLRRARVRASIADPRTAYLSARLRLAHCFSATESFRARRQKRRAVTGLMGNAQRSAKPDCGTR